MCPITIVPASDPPDNPVISSGSCTAGTALTITISSVNSEGDDIRYGVDWDADGTLDQFVPASGYVPSGTPQNASRTYSEAGSKTIKVAAIDEHGTSSEWTSFVFDCIEPPSLTCSVTFEKNPIEAGESTTVHWASTGAALLYLNSIGYVGASGSATVSPTHTTDFSGYVSNSADGGGEASYCPATLRVNQLTAECPPGTHLVNGVCVVDESCAIGYVYQGGACVFTSCPVGYVKQGTACVFQGCPVGYTLQNGACVWSGCPEGFFQQGSQCVLENQCVSLPYCQGQDLFNGCTHERIQVCQYGCASGACKGVPSPTAALSASPSLVIKGKTTKLSWNSKNTSSCTLTGGNGDSFEGKSMTNQVSGPIQSTTIFTLRCEGLEGSSPAFVERKVTVNVRPDWVETPEPLP